MADTFRIITIDECQACLAHEDGDRDPFGCSIQAFREHIDYFEKGTRDTHNTEGCLSCRDTEQYLAEQERIARLVADLDAEPEPDTAG